MFKDELDGGIMTENANARAKTYAYNYDNNKDFKNSVLRNETAIRSQIRFRTDHHCQKNLQKK